MKVVEHQHEWRGGRDATEEIDDGAEQQVLLRLRIDVVAGGQIHSRRQFGEEARKLAPTHLDVLAEQVEGRVRAQVRECVHPWLVRDDAVLVAASVEHDRTERVRVTSERGRQARLTDARLSREDRDPAQTIGPGRLERPVECFALALARDEHLLHHEARRQRHVHGRRRDRGHQVGRGGIVERLPCRAKHLDRLWEPLQVQRAHSLEAMTSPAARQGAGKGADEDRTRFGGRLETSGLDDRGAVTVVGHEVHIAGAHPDAEHEPLEVGGRTVVDLRRLVGGHRGIEPVARGLEHGHEAVTGALDHGSPMTADGAAQQEIEQGGQSVGRVVPEGCSLRSGADQVAEHHGRRRHPALRHSPILSPSARMV